MNSFKHIFEKTSALLERLFDFRGRAGRAELCLIVTLGLAYIAALLAVAIAHLYWVHNEAQNFVYVGEARQALFSPTVITGYVLWGFCATAGTIAVVVAQIFAAIRRLNDLNKSRWIALLGLIPLVNLVFLVFLLFVPAANDDLFKTNRTTAVTDAPSP